MKRVWNNPREGDLSPEWFSSIFQDLRYKDKKVKIKKITMEFKYD